MHKPPPLLSYFHQRMGLSNVTRLILELWSSGPLDFSNLNLTTLQVLKSDVDLIFVSF